MRNMVLAALAILAFATTSCSSFSLVYSEEFPDQNIANYKTFRIVEPKEGELAPGVEMVTYHNIVSSIKTELLERGFKEDKNSTLLVNLGITVKNDVQTEQVPTNPFFYGPGPMGPVPVFAPYFIAPRYEYWGPTTNVVTGVYEKGVLTMDMVDTKKKTPVYSSAVSAMLGDNDAKYRDIHAIHEAVSVLFSKFPVPLLPKYANKK